MQPQPRRAPDADAGQTAQAPLAYSVTGAAKELSVSPKHLRMLIATGKVPFVKLGERTVIRRATLERLLAEMEQRSTGR